MKKYSRLKQFLSLNHGTKTTLTLKQIEIIINSALPESARAYDAWWRDPFSHPHVTNWSDIGWKVAVHSEKGEIAWVTFTKSQALTLKG